MELQSYGVSLAIMVSHSVTCHPTQVNTPCLNASQTGRYSIYSWNGRLSWRSSSVAAFAKNVFIFKYFFNIQMTKRIIVYSVHSAKEHRNVRNASNAANDCHKITHTHIKWKKDKVRSLEHGVCPLSNPFAIYRTIISLFDVESQIFVIMQQWSIQGKFQWHCCLTSNPSPVWCKSCCMCSDLEWLID